MNIRKNYIISTIITLVGALILFYMMLPPLNPTSPSFWVFLMGVLILYAICSFILAININGRLERIPKIPSYLALGAGICIVIIIVVNIACSPLFQASSYANRITVIEDANFEEDIPQVNFNALPLLDKDSSQRLGDRVLGQMPELVSQFEVSNLYTQINYNDEIIRVTPLEYADWIKYFTNHSDGVKGYITVNSVTGEANLVPLEHGMKYMPSALFGEDLLRHLRFQYPTEIFGDYEFEIDNEGNPYWVIPTMKYTGVGMKREVSGIILLNPITGDTTKYQVEEVPTWIDHVYKADLIIEQLDNWGQYRSGFWNSIFGQKNVVRTTEGYNYTVMNDDVYLYTGVTSVISDQSNLGFILTNMRTKETKFYSVPGAKETSAMASAEGQVQQMSYHSTFPLLINLNHKPTYLVSLKDNAGLVKMYAFIDVVDYQKVVVTDASEGIEAAAENYLGEDITSSEKLLEKTIQIQSIDSATIDGTTYYYYIDTENKRYKVSVKVDSNRLPFIKVGDSLTITYETEQETTEIVGIK